MIGKILRKMWWLRQGSNLGPSHYECDSRAFNGAGLRRRPLKTNAISNSRPLLTSRTAALCCSRFAAVGALALSAAHADPALILGGPSIHLVSDETTNDAHGLVAIEYRQTVVARFANSYGRPSFAAAYGWSGRWGHLRGSVHVGGVYGYRGCWHDERGSAALCPMVAGSVSYTRFDVEPTAIMLGDAVVAAVRAPF